MFQKKILLVWSISHYSHPIPYQITFIVYYKTIINYTNMVIIPTYKIYLNGTHVVIVSWWRLLFHQILRMKSSHKKYPPTTLHSMVTSGTLKTIRTSDTLNVNPSNEQPIAYLCNLQCYQAIISTHHSMKGKNRDFNLKPHICVMRWCPSPHRRSMDAEVETNTTCVSLRGMCYATDNYWNNSV